MHHSHAQSDSAKLDVAPPALAELLAERREPFLAFVRKRVRSGADAEDLLQTALLRSTEKIGTLKQGERLDAWFYRILRNTIADHHADWARREARIELIARDASELPPDEAAVCACSLGVLDGLSTEYAEILRAIDIEDASIDEAAARFSITPNNTKVRLHRARKAMRDALGALCGTNSIKACLSCDCD